MNISTVETHVTALAASVIPVVVLVDPGLAAKQPVITGIVTAASAVIAVGVEIFHALTKHKVAVAVALAKSAVPEVKTLVSDVKAA